MNKKFSDRLREILNDKNIKASRLADMTGLSESLISQYLNDKIEPKNDKLLLISEALNIDILLLMGIKQSETPIDPRFNDFKFALMHGESDLSEDQKEDLLNYYEFIKSKKG